MITVSTHMLDANSDVHIATFDSLLRIKIGNGGEFVRTRDHIKTKLPWELRKIGPTRLVFGTMTDPYQPIEKDHRLTRLALQIIKDSGIQYPKIGIYTRSPLIKHDLELIQQLPNPQIHYTVTPFDRETLKKIEPIPIHTEARFATIEQIKNVGIRTHVNVAPAISILSEQFIRPYAERLAEIGVDEFFTDPMQPYGVAIDSLEQALKDAPRWPEIKSIMTNKKKYRKWKHDFQQQWTQEWRRVAHKSPHTLALAQDHQTKHKINMVTEEVLPWDHD